MNYELKTQVEITLRLTQEEFNTIVCGYGASNFARRDDVAVQNGLKLLNKSDSDEFYEKLKEVALSLHK